MNSIEAGQLLAHASAFDNRQPSKAAAEAWAAALHDVPLDEDTLAAVARYYGTVDPEETGKKWLQPHHVRTHRQALRADRLPPGAGLSPAIPQADPDDVPAYLAALRAQNAIEAIAGQPALPAGETPGYDDSPTVRKIRAQFDAQRAAARARKATEAEAERQAVRAYMDAVAHLLDLPDHGEAAMTAARKALFGDEQAAQGFPLAADRIGVTDDHKVVILAAEIAREKP